MMMTKKVPAMKRRSGTRKMRAKVKILSKRMMSGLLQNWAKRSLVRDQTRKDSGR